MTDESVTNLEAVRPREEEIGGDENNLDDGGDENNLDENDPSYFSRPLVLMPGGSGIRASRHKFVELSHEP